MCSFVYIQILSLFSYVPLLEGDFTNQKAVIYKHLSSNEPVKIEIPSRATFFKFKKEFEEIIEKFPNKYIAIVTYDPAYSIHDEIVYNKADIANAKLIWAHDLGDEKNKSLIDYYNDRKVVFIKFPGTQVEILPKNKY